MPTEQASKNILERRDCFLAFIKMATAIPSWKPVKHQRQFHNKDFHSFFPGLHQTVRIVPFAVISIFERSQTNIFVLGLTKSLDVPLFLLQFSYFKSPSCETIQQRIDILLFSFPRC